MERNGKKYIFWWTENGHITQEKKFSRTALENIEKLLTVLLLGSTGLALAFVLFISC